MDKAISGLYAVTPGGLDTPTLVRKLQAALAGGARAVQYRNKDASGALQREQLAAIAPLCRSAGVPLIVNDSTELTLAAQADGVHLGRDDGTVAEARSRLGHGKLIGVSCYDDLGRARDAVSAGADYLAFGSFFPSATKPGAVRAAPDILRAARRAWTLPIVAIGGIDARNAAALIEAGADAVAVVSAVFEAPDVAAAARDIAALFHSSTARMTP
jgi:thiamine-phosphate pyrophosphorylase